MEITCLWVFSVSTDIGLFGKFELLCVNKHMKVGNKLYVKNTNKKHPEIHHVTWRCMSLQLLYWRWKILQNEFNHRNCVWNLIRMLFVENGTLCLKEFPYIGLLLSKEKISNNIRKLYDIFFNDILLLRFTVEKSDNGLLFGTSEWQQSQTLCGNILH